MQLCNLSLTFGWMAALGLGLSGCFGSQGKSTSSAKKPEVLKVQLSSEPLTLDPSWFEDGNSMQIIENLHDGLFGYSGSGELELRLAKSYRILSDGKLYEFELRRDAKWSDGKPVRAEDFVTAFRRILGPHSIAKLAPVFFPIKNAREVRAGKVPVEALGVMEKNGKLVIQLQDKMPFLPHALTLPLSYPLRQEILDAHQGAWPEDAPSTGPYRWTSHVLDQKIGLKRNEQYWGGSPAIDEVEFYLITDETTALHLYEQNRIHVLQKIPSFDLDRLKRKGEVVVQPIYATYYLSFNLNKGPLSDREFRKAFAQAIQKKEIIHTLGTYEIPAWSWVPPGLEGALIQTDPDAARTPSSAVRLKKSPPIIASFDSGGRNSRIFEKVQVDVEASLGVQLSLHQSDWKSYIQMLQTDPPAVFRFAWIAPFFDPILFLQVFVSDNPNNYSRFSNAKYDALVREIEHLSSGPLREKKIREAQKLLLEEEYALVPIFHYVQNIAVQPEVKGFKMTPFGVISLKDVRWANEPKK